MSADVGIEKLCTDIVDAIADGYQPEEPGETILGAAARAVRKAIASDPERAREVARALVVWADSRDGIKAEPRMGGLSLRFLRTFLKGVPTQHDGEDVIIECTNQDGDIVQFPLTNVSYEHRCAETPALFLHTSTEDAEEREEGDGREPIETAKTDPPPAVCGKVFMAPNGGTGQYDVACEERAGHDGPCSSFYRDPDKARRVDSYGTCGRCGYHGPGPWHECKAADDGTVRVEEPSR